MLHLDVRIEGSIVSATFANFFLQKANTLTNEARISANVYNGTRKITCNEKIFISVEDIKLSNLIYCKEHKKVFSNTTRCKVNTSSYVI